MATALGLVGFIAFITAVIALAAGVTWIVVRLSPKTKPKPESSSTG